MTKTIELVSEAEEVNYDISLFVYLTGWTVATNANQEKETELKNLMDKIEAQCEKMVKSKKTGL